MKFLVVIIKAALPALQLSRATLLAACAFLVFTLAVSSCDNPSTGADNTAAAEEDPAIPVPKGTAPPMMPQEELKAAYNNAPGLLAQARTRDIFSQFRAIQQVQITPVEDTLKVVATGRDPQILLPGFTRGRKFVVEVTITSPAETQLQAFYLRSGQNKYSNPQSEVAPLAPGRNVVYLRFDAPNIVDPLRLDVGDVPGEYLIESMIARVLPN